MHDGGDLDRVGTDLVDEDIVRVNDRLPRSLDPPGTIHERSFAQLLGAGADGRVQSLGGE